MTTPTGLTIIPHEITDGGRSITRINVYTEEEFANLAHKNSVNRLIRNLIG